MQRPEPFSFHHRGTELVYGRESLQQLGSVLDEHGHGQVLIVCGSNVGTNEAVLSPLEDGLGDRAITLFAKTTPEKEVETAFKGAEVIEQRDIEVIIGVGGGSSLDIARFMSAIDGNTPTLADLKRAVDPTERVHLLDIGGSTTPWIAIPTTFAGAEISNGCSLDISDKSDGDGHAVNRIRISDPETNPIAAIYDPAVSETTPMSVLASSAMNGFDKGIENLYARSASAITDATSIRGLRYLLEGLPQMSSGDPAAIERSIVGIVLVQFERRTAIIHAFGHGFSQRYPVQQGHIHAIVAPHVLGYVFGEVDGRRNTIAEGLDVLSESGSDDELDRHIVERVRSIRDQLGLPTRLRDLDPVEPDDFREIAAFVMEDFPMKWNPPGLDPSMEDIEGVIQDAW